MKQTFRNWRLTESRLLYKRVPAGAAAEAPKDKPSDTNKKISEFMSRVEKFVVGIADFMKNLFPKLFEGKSSIPKRLENADQKRRTAASDAARAREQANILPPAERAQVGEALALAVPDNTDGLGDLFDASIAPDTEPPSEPESTDAQARDADNEETPVRAIPPARQQSQSGTAKETPSAPATDANDAEAPVRALRPASSSTTPNEPVDSSSPGADAASDTPDTTVSSPDDPVFDPDAAATPDPFGQTPTPTNTAPTQQAAPSGANNNAQPRAADAYDEAPVRGAGNVQSPATSSQPPAAPAQAPSAPAQAPTAAPAANAPVAQVNVQPRRGRRSSRAPREGGPRQLDTTPKPQDISDKDVFQFWREAVNLKDGLPAQVQNDINTKGDILTADERTDEQKRELKRMTAYTHQYLADLHARMHPGPGKTVSETSRGAWEQANAWFQKLNTQYEMEFGHSYIPVYNATVDKKGFKFSAPDITGRTGLMKAEKGMSALTNAEFENKYPVSQVMQQMQNLQAVSDDQLMDLLLIAREYKRRASVNANDAQSVVNNNKLFNALDKELKRRNTGANMKLTASGESVPMGIDDILRDDYKAMGRGQEFRDANTGRSVFENNMKARNTELANSSGGRWERKHEKYHSSEINRALNHQAELSDFKGQAMKDWLQEIDYQQQQRLQKRGGRVLGLTGNDVKYNAALDRAEQQGKIVSYPYGSDTYAYIDNPNMSRNQYDSGKGRYVDKRDNYVQYMYGPNGAAGRLGMTPRKPIDWSRIRPSEESEILGKSLNANVAELTEIYSDLEQRAAVFEQRENPELRKGFRMYMEKVQRHLADPQKYMGQLSKDISDGYGIFDRIATRAEAAPEAVEPPPEDVPQVTVDFEYKSVFNPVRIQELNPPKGKKALIMDLMSDKPGKGLENKVDYRSELPITADQLSDLGKRGIAYYVDYSLDKTEIGRRHARSITFFATKPGVHFTINGMELDSRNWVIPEKQTEMPASQKTVTSAPKNETTTPSTEKVSAPKTTVVPASQTEPTAPSAETISVPPAQKNTVNDSRNSEDSMFDAADKKIDAIEEGTN